ncbi:DUF192 domain-containing protein [Chitinophaga sp. GCM10012297]|uniref:DUF192 domain-containing protein n=1 Tax=Chitinophaga chungangae TaxID=2821488 RepID=A0ABS3YB05_9BACT|nr:DUF192 domain-containing protein [Chitinophaga chungangae]MBO9151867.1 DUF192 domain-containing protein [Chitinophaga chungangae]
MKNFMWTLAISGFAFAASCQNQPKQESSAESASASSATATTPAVTGGPVFKKEGSLSFISKAKGDTIKTIDIEIAETDDERARGLMDRKSMLDSQGMLFIFAAPEEQSFWMKNTYISLDIMYVDEKFEIVSIQKYATPLSEESLPSFKKAQYVVETNAGFADKYKIAFGDKIAFTKQ